MRKTNEVAINMNKGRASNSSGYSQSSCSQSVSSQQECSQSVDDINCSHLSRMALDTPTNTPISRLTSTSDESGKRRKRHRSIGKNFFLEAADDDDDDSDNCEDDEADDKSEYDSCIVRDEAELVYIGPNGEDTSVPYGEESTALYDAIKGISISYNASLRNMEKRDGMQDNDIIEDIITTLSELSVQFNETSTETLRKEERSECKTIIRHGTVCTYYTLTF